ncbi:MAG: hypothetical protein JNL16_16280 [Dechloromonas sp.]|nr:hypothetical protein [Dechloromonas sp.]
MMIASMIRSAGLAALWKKFIKRNLFCCGKWIGKRLGEKYAREKILSWQKYAHGAMDAFGKVIFCVPQATPVRQV